MTDAFSDEFLARTESRTDRLWRQLRFGVGALLVLCIASVLLLRWFPPPTTAFVLGARIDAWQAGRENFEIRRHWVAVDSISPNLALAVVAAEDQRFPEHWGFDWQAIRMLFNRTGSNEHLRGASTISQQTAKNLFLWRSRSFLRKGVEAGFTVLLEALLPKRRILELYLNIAQFGDGIYGVEAASAAFFRQPASRIDAAQAALLAAVLPNPLRFRADRPSAYVIKRREWILRQMHQLGGAHYLQALLKP